MKQTIGCEEKKFFHPIALLFVTLCGEHQPLAGRRRQERSVLFGIFAVIYFSIFQTEVV